MTPRTLEEVRAEGIQALAAALGPDDMVRFLLLFDHGKGDYTEQRQGWVDQLDLDTIVREIERQREAPSTPEDRRLNNGSPA